MKFLINNKARFVDELNIQMKKNISKEVSDFVQPISGDNYNVIAYEKRNIIFTKINNAKLKMGKLLESDFCKSQSLCISHFSVDGNEGYAQKDHETGKRNYVVYHGNIRMRVSWNVLDENVTKRESIHVYIKDDGTIKIDEQDELRYKKINFDTCNVLIGNIPLKDALDKGNWLYDINHILLKKIYSLCGISPEKSEKVNKNVKNNQCEGSHFPSNEQEEINRDDFTIVDSIVNEIMLLKTVDNNSHDLDSNDSCCAIAIAALFSINVIHSIIGSNPNIVKIQNNQGDTLLHIVIRSSNCIKVIQYLIKIDPNIVKIQNNQGDTPLHLALKLAKKIDIIDLFTQYITDIIEIQNNQGDTPLHLGMEFYDDIKVIQYLMGKGEYKQKNIRAMGTQNERGDTSLHIAVRLSRDMKIIGLFLTYNTRVINIKNNKGDTPLHTALESHCNESVVLSIIKNKVCNVSIQNEQGDMLLHIAFRSGYSEVVTSCLIKKNPSAISVQNKQGDTPLHIAAALPNNIKAIQCLIKRKNCNIDAINHQAETALYIPAGIFNNMNAINYLKDKGASIKKEGNTILHAAAKVSNNKEFIQYLLGLEYININAKDAGGNTALHYAAASSGSEVIRLLIEAGANVNDQNERRETALHIAVSASNIEGVRCLVEIAKCDIDAETKERSTAAHLAVEFSRLEILSYLVGKGADIKTRDKEGNTILHTAVMDPDNAEIVQYLLQQFQRLAININSWNYEYSTPLHIAVSIYSNIKIVKHLVEAGANLNFVDDETNTALDIAEISLNIVSYENNKTVERGFEEIMRYCQEKGGLFGNEIIKNILSIISHTHNLPITLYNPTVVLHNSLDEPSTSANTNLSWVEPHFG